VTLAATVVTGRRHVSLFPALVYLREELRLLEGAQLSILPGRLVALLSCELEIACLRFRGASSDAGLRLEYLGPGLEALFGRSQCWLRAGSELTELARVNAEVLVCLKREYG
jgi:hypothetical protein